MCPPENFLARRLEHDAGLRTGNRCGKDGCAARKAQRMRSGFSVQPAPKNTPTVKLEPRLLGPVVVESGYPSNAVAIGQARSPAALGWSMTLARLFGAIMNQLSRFRRDKRGNVALILALAALPRLAAVGVAIDYSLAVRMRTKLQSAP